MDRWEIATGSTQSWRCQPQLRSEARHTKLQRCLRPEIFTAAQSCIYTRMCETIGDMMAASTRISTHVQGLSSRCSAEVTLIMYQLLGLSSQLHRVQSNRRLRDGDHHHSTQPTAVSPSAELYNLRSAIKSMQANMRRACCLEAGFIQPLPPSIGVHSFKRLHSRPTLSYCCTCSETSFC